MLAPAYVDISKCPPAIAHASPASASSACDACGARFQRRFPKGTRIYAFDDLIVKTKDRTIHVSAASTIRCTDTGVVIEDPQSKRSVSVPRSAKLAIVRGYRETAVLPGKQPDAELRRDLRLGIAYLKAIL